MNGVLTPGSYTASGCHFVNEPYDTLDQKLFKLGASYESGSASASVNWFTRDAELNQTGVRSIRPGATTSLVGSDLQTPVLSNPLMQGRQLGLDPLAGEPLQYLSNEASGIDLNFRVGITTDNAGDIRLGLALTRLLEAGYQGTNANAPNVLELDYCRTVQRRPHEYRVEPWILQQRHPGLLPRTRQFP